MGPQQAPGWLGPPLQTTTGGEAELGFKRMRRPPLLPYPEGSQMLLLGLLSLQQADCSPFSAKSRATCAAHKDEEALVPAVQSAQSSGLDTEVKEP